MMFKSAGWHGDMLVPSRVTVWLFGGVKNGRWKLWIVQSCCFHSMMVEFGTLETSHGKLREAPVAFGCVCVCVGALDSHNLGDIPNKYPSELRCTT